MLAQEALYSGGRHPNPNQIHLLSRCTWGKGLLQLQAPWESDAVGRQSISTSYFLDVHC